MYDTILKVLISCFGAALFAFIVYAAIIARGAAKRGYVIDEHGDFYRWDFARGPRPPSGGVDADTAATLERVDY